MIRRTTLLAAGGLAAVLLSGSQAAAQRTAGGHFPTPFVIEHSITVTDPDGSVFVGDTVVDHYGGSWIVSVREDSSRLVIDFSRRELTEIRPETGTYTVISFDRMAQLTREIKVLEGRTTRSENSGNDSDPSTKAFATPEFRVASANGPSVSRLTTTDPSARSLLQSTRVRHLEVAAVDASGTARPAIEVWVDPQLRFSPTGLAAVEDFEQRTLGATTAAEKLVPLNAIAAARRHADGAVPIATARSVAGGRGRIEDVARRAAPLDVFPVDLLKIPDGFTRAPHPLELMRAHAEREVELRDLMSTPADGGAR